MRTHGRRRAIVIASAALGIVGVTAGTALARWSTTGTGTGTLTAGTINPPAAGDVTTTGTTNAVNVAVGVAPATGATVQGYRIDRTAPTSLVGACYITASTGNCNAPADGSGTQTYNIVSYRGTQTLQSWTSSALSRTGTPATTLAITGVTRSGGQKKVTFNGTGAAATTTLTVTICAADSWPCSTANNKGTSTIQPATAGNWGPSGQSSNNLADSTTYYARATQGSNTSATFSFTVTNL